MDKNKVVEFVKTHKKEIAIAAGLTVVGIAVAKYLKADDLPRPANWKVHEALRKTEEAFNNAYDVGVLHDITTEYTLDSGEKVINAIVNDMTPADLGRLGDDLLRVDGVNLETMISAIVSFTVK